jgi:hypothetical protein
MIQIDNEDFWAYFLKSSVFGNYIAVVTRLVAKKFTIYCMKE